MPSCMSPKDCDPGQVCCFQVTALAVTCQPPLLCPGDAVDSYLVCGNDLDCPKQTPGSCNAIPDVPDGGPLICNPSAAPAQ
jgi:hypothetical protein